jgi:hypothetical protein
MVSLPSTAGNAGGGKSVDYGMMRQAIELFC